MDAINAINADATTDLMLNELVLFNHPSSTDSVTPATVISIAISIGSNPKICIVIDKNCDIYVISWLNRNFVRAVGGEKTNSEVIYKIITENQTKCSVCGHNDFTVSVERNFISLILGQTVQQNHGIEVILVICKKCGHIMMFGDGKSKN